MASTESSLGPGGLPVWVWIVAILGLAWNAFGAVQFVGSLNATTETLQAQGMTSEQAAVMLGYPAWMTVAFAIGVFGGLLGCVLLLLRQSLAVLVFVISLVAYLALYVGDIVHGVFAAMGMPQIVILTIVVLIAAGLLWVSRRVRAMGAMR